MKHIFGIIKLQTSCHIIATALTISYLVSGEWNGKWSQSSSNFLFCTPRTVVLLL